jgi:hypothetical protein
VPLQKCAGIAAQLDKPAPAHPTLLAAWSGHAVILSSGAVKEFEVPAAGPAPGGFYGKDARGKSWDRFVRERARFPVTGTRTVSDEVLRQRIAAFLEEAPGRRITSLQSLAFIPDPLMRLLQQTGTRLGVRIFPMPLANPAEAQARSHAASGAERRLRPLEAGPGRDAGGALPGDAPGMKAGLAFSRNILEATPPDLPKTASVSTMIGRTMLRRPFRSTAFALSAVYAE